jgi:hypothetical protein
VRATWAPRRRRNLLVIDDWGLAPLTPTERRDLLEVLEDRAEHASTVITSQVPLKGWHDLIGEPTHADAICDRLIHTASVIELQGPSLHETRPARSRAAPVEVTPIPHQTPRPSLPALENDHERHNGPPGERLGGPPCNVLAGVRYLDIPPGQAPSTIYLRKGIARGDNRAGVASLRRAITISRTRDHDRAD